MQLFRVGAILLVASCSGGGGVNSNDQAEAAYLGLDPSIDKAIQLGFDGFNAASSANIPPQHTTGDVSGTMDITGQADQGTSPNKTMRLNEALANYQDVADAGITYATDTDAGLPALNMDLKGIPTGTVTGTLVGSYGMTGSLQGTVALNVAFDGQLQLNPQNAAQVERKPGTTHITGTATSGSGTFTVDVTR